jgi:N-acyl-D-aspartate/D-glutamate deacylase
VGAARGAGVVDVVIRGGTVVDGTGAASFVADVSVAHGRVVALDAPGSASADGGREIDADGLVVAPGFVDVHTHLDAQVFWDPACTPLPQHGVTTALAGNCGFTIAPLAPENADYLMRMLARVEGIPLEALEAGVPWSWKTTAEYLDAVQLAEPVVNLGFMVGHSALRRAVMGADAVGGVADTRQVEAMQALLREGLAAGGFGFSSSWSRSHWDGDGEPVPSRAASRDELLALCSVLVDFPGTQVEFLPTNENFGDEHLDVMASMSLASGRPLNWNVYIPRGNQPDQCARKLSASDYARERGAQVFALTYPDVIRARMTFLGAGFDPMPGWAPVMALASSEKLAALQDPEVRARLLAGSQSPEAGNYRDTVADWANMTVAETFAPEHRGYEGRTLGDIGRERGQDPFDALLDIVVGDDLRTGLTPVPPAADDDSWALRVESWTDPRVVLGASDAGAHLDLIATYDWAPRFLALARDRAGLPIEDSVRRVTSVQADLYGLAGRGRIEPDAVADIVVFDPERIGPGRVTWRDDLPAGAGRLSSEPTGIEHVLVAGVEVVRGTELTGRRPGRVLRPDAR